MSEDVVPSPNFNVSSSSSSSECQTHLGTETQERESDTMKVFGEASEKDGRVVLVLQPKRWPPDFTENK